MQSSSAPARVALLAVAGALLGGALFAGGGSGDGSLVWLGGGAAIAAAAGWALAFAGLLPRPTLGRDGAVFLALFAALVAWVGVAISWSIAPDRSWAYLDRGLAYLGLVLVGTLLAAVLRRPFRTAADGLALLLGAALAWALAGKVLPGIGPDSVGPWVARLRSPVGYWNALALVGDVALLLGLSLAADRARSRGARVAGALLVYVSTLAVLLTYSRTGIVIAALAALAWVVLARERLAGIAALVLGVGGALVVLGFALSLDGVGRDGATHGQRVHDGALFAAPLLLAAAAVAGLAWLALAHESRIGERTAQRVVRLTAWVAGAAVVAALVAGVVHAGGPGPFVRHRWDEFANPAQDQVTSGATRLDTLSSNNRWIWWSESWHVFTGSPWTGKGPATFDLSHRLLRTNALVATEPHNLPVQLLGETGILGFLLGLGAAGGALWVAWAALRRARDERPAALALGLAVPVWLAHALVDFTFDFAAATAPVLLAAGVLAAGRREPRTEPARRSWLGVAGAAVACLAVLWSLGAPWLASRRVDQGYAALERGDLKGAIAKAKDARSLDPLSLDPLFLQALAEGTRGDLQAAFRLYRQRILQQPENWEPWYSAGVFLMTAAKDPCVAYDFLNEAYTRDRFGAAGEPGGYLDRARAVRNSGRCGRR